MHDEAELADPERLAQTGTANWVWRSSPRPGTEAVQAATKPERRNGFPRAERDARTAARRRANKAQVTTKCNEMKWAVFSQVRRETVSGATY